LRIPKNTLQLRLLYNRTPPPSVPLVANLDIYTPAPASYDLILSICCALHPTPRARLHAACVDALRPGGLLVVVAFAPRQAAARHGHVIHTGASAVHTGDSAVHTGASAVHTGASAVHTGASDARGHVPGHVPIHTGSSTVHTGASDASGHVPGHVPIHTGSSAVHTGASTAVSLAPALDTAPKPALAAALEPALDPALDAAALYAEGNVARRALNLRVNRYRSIDRYLIGG